MPKTSTYALGSVAGLALLIGGSLVFVIAGRGPDDTCGGAALDGESALIGGPFTLVDGSGIEVTDKSVLVKPSLVYFGYTFCPDVCPFDVARNADAADILAGSGLEVTPVFITVDPKRDTSEVVAEYAEAFHPKMIGLTGSPSQVQEAAKAYKVYFRTHDSDEKDEFYLVDHSTFTYLELPNEGVVDYFGRDDTAATLAERTACQIKRFG